MAIHECMPVARFIACRQTIAAGKELLHSTESTLHGSLSLPEVQVAELHCSASGIVGGERPVLSLMTCHLQGRLGLLLLAMYPTSAMFPT